MQYRNKTHTAFHFSVFQFMKTRQNKQCGIPWATEESELNKQ